MKNKQGLFHLLAILFIPGLLVSIFLLQNPWLSMVLVLILLFITWYLFFK